MLKSCAKAWTFDQFVEYCSQTINNEEASTNLKNTCNIIVSNQGTLRGYVPESATSFLITNATATGWIDLRTFNTTINPTGTTETSISFGSMSTNQYRLARNPFSVTSSTTNLSSISTTGFGLIEISNEELIPQSLWLQNRYIQGMEFSPISTEVVSVGNYENVQAKLINLIDGGIFLGRLTKFNDSYNWYYYQLTDENNNIVGYCNYKRYNDYYDGEDMQYFPSNNSVYIARRKIYLKNIYTLTIYASEEKLKSDYSNVGDSLVYTYIFLPQNAVISNGIITNYGSGDNYNVQDSTNDIINNINDSSDVTNILDSYFPTISSGNISGELNKIASEFGFTPLDNPFTTFLLHILESTYDALTLREPVVLTADYKTMHFVLSSEQFRTPDSDLKYFIRNCMIFLYLYGNYIFFHHLLTLIETARIDKAVAVLGTDEFYDSDIL